MRKFAARSLQEILDEQALPALITALADEMADVRKEAAIALGNLADPIALNALQQAADDPDRDVAIYTQRAIAKIHSVA